MKDSRNTQTRQRQVRQEALRQQLSNQKHVEHVVDMAQKLSDESIEIESQMVHRLKIAIDAKMRIVNKYLPDLKATEHSGELNLINLTDEQLNAELARELT